MSRMWCALLRAEAFAAVAVKRVAAFFTLAIWLSEFLHRLVLLSIRQRLRFGRRPASACSCVLAREYATSSLAQVYTKTRQTIATNQRTNWNASQLEISLRVLFTWHVCRPTWCFLCNSTLVAQLHAISRKLLLSFLRTCCLLPSGKQARQALPWQR